MTYATPDLDAWTIPAFSTLDGIEGLYADDDRAVDLWSHYHASRVNQMLRILRARIAAFEWQLRAVAPRADAAATAAIESQLAGAREALRTEEAKRDALERARLADSYAPRDWTWA